MLDPSGRLIFATGVSSDSLAVFGRLRGTGPPNFAEAKFDGVDAARWADVSSDGAHVYVASLVDASVAVFKLTIPEVPALGPWGIGALGCFLILAAAVAKRRGFRSAS